MTDNQGTMKLHILLEEEEKINLIGLLFPDKAEPAGLVWLSDHEEIAAVTSGGVVTGVKAGTAKITVKNADSTMADSVMVLVMGKEDTGLRLSILLKPAEKCRLVAMFGDTQGTAKWSSADDTVAAVDQQGRVTAVAVGTTLITVTSEDGSMTDQVYVTVRGEAPEPEPTDEVTEPNDTPLELPEEIPQKSLEEVWSNIQKTPIRNTRPVITKLGTIEGGSQQYCGGVVATNGKIYAIPGNATAVLEIDPQTGGMETFGFTAGSGKQYAGGVLAPNGKIYGIPYSANTILEINPQDKTLRHIGSVPGKNQYSGGVLAPNGKIYGIPYGAMNVLEFDPQTEEITYLGQDVITYSGAIYCGAVLAPNGKIYGFPINENTILEIDPQTGVVSKFGKLSGCGFEGAVLAPNGKIYGIPGGAAYVLEIDPDSHATRRINQFPNGLKFSGGALGADGKIYGVPWSDKFTTIMEVNPQTDYIAQFGYLEGGYQYSGCVLAPNGKIYTIPSGAKVVYEIDPGWRYKDPSVCLSPYLNKF